MQITPTDQTPRIALFIDFDNGQLDITRVLNALRERGIIILKKAYGDWAKFPQFRKTLAENGVDLVERPTIFAGGDKNGADIQLAVDALEACLTNHHIDVFAVVSGDSDFLPLISRLQAYNKKVVIIGMRQTTSSVVMKNCNEYLAYENIVDPLQATEGMVGETKETDPKDLPKAFAILKRAIALLEDEDRSVDSSNLKQKMLQLSPTFDEKSFGFSQFKAFLAEAQRRKIIHIGKKVDGAYPIVLGRMGRLLEDGEEEGEADVQAAPGQPLKKPKKRRSGKR
ncbi:MAG: NYN domain-containing protein [Acidobacteriota bacterium]